MKSDVKEWNEHSLVMRLERNQHDLLKMKLALSSYICEPRTHSLFERCQSLKNKMEYLRNTNTEVLQSLKGRKESVSKYVERAKLQFQEFYTLQEGLEDYMVGVRNH